MYTVILSDDAVRVMVASALEAYSSPHGRNLDVEKHVPLETIGAIWGYETQRNGQTCFHVVSADVETSAHRRPDSVRPKVESFEIRKGFYQFMNPEVQCLGEFHSHPWHRGETPLDGKVIQGPQDIEKQRLYRFSGEPIGAKGKPTGDYCLPSSSGFPYRIGLVVTLYRMNNQVLDPLHRYIDSYSGFRFTYFGPIGFDDDKKPEMVSFRCWIKAHVFPNGDATPAADEDVQLQCAALGFLPKIDFMSDNFGRSNSSM